MDRVRVLRIIEYTGPRDKVEVQVARSVHGLKEWGNGVTIRATTIGEYPEIIEGSDIVPFKFAPTRWQRIVRWWKSRVMEMTYGA